MGKSLQRLLPLYLGASAVLFGLIPSTPYVGPQRDASPDSRLLLQQVLYDVLTGPGLQDARDFYGTSGDRMVGLDKDSKVAFPADWQPQVPGRQFLFLHSQLTPLEEIISTYIPGGDDLLLHLETDRPRMLGIRLEKLNLDPRRSYDDQIEIQLFNIGGSANGAVIGGCFVQYTIVRRNGHWVAEYSGSYDP